MDPKFKLRPVIQDLKLKQYLKFLTNQGQNPVTLLEHLVPGAEVSFQLETGKEAILSYVGQEPEKVVMDLNTRKLRVMMPDKGCILIFRVEADAREVEVAYSF